MTTPRTGRPPLVSRDAIIEAVLLLGFDEASMTAVATHLGVEPSTLYRHVDGRADMLGEAADRAIERALWPAVPADRAAWRDFLRAYADGIWALLGAHRGLAAYLRASNGVPLELVRHALTVVGFLRDRVGMSMLDAAIIVDTVGDLTVDAHLIAQQLAAAETADGNRPVEQYTVLAERIGDGDPALKDIAAEYFTVVVGAVHDAPGRDDWWRRKVDLVLDGIARAHRL